MKNKASEQNVKPKPPVVRHPKGSDEERHRIFTQLAIKSVAELRKHLDPNSTSKSIIFAPHIPKARDYVISGMLNEVEKASISAMSTSSFILESNKETRSEEQLRMMKEMPDLEDNIFQSRIDEMVLWERKLTEQLIDIVGFRHVKKDDYYRHYIILGEIDRLSKISSDFKEYHGAKNLNIENQLEELRQKADKIFANLDPDKCWYLKSKDPAKKDHYKIASYRDRLNRTLPWMSANQKLMAGMSYGEYSVQSGSLHPGQAKIKDSEPSMEQLDNHFMRVTMLAAEVVLGAKDAMSMHNKRGWLGDISKMNKGNTYPKELLAELTKPEIEKGDFVVAYGDLAEVVKVTTTKFGYRSFRVKYLEKPPIPSIPIDEMPARYVKLYQKRKTIVDGVVKLLTKEGLPKPLTRRVNEAARKTIVSFWAEMGGKEMAFGKKEEGLAKMRAFHEKEQSKEPPTTSGSGSAKS